MNLQPQNQTTAPIETPSVLDGIIQAFYAQIAEFQEAIGSREPGKRYPEIGEVTWLTKMIACADKLVKQNAPDKHHKSIKTFIKYAGADEPKLGKAMQAAYRDYVYEFGGGPAEPFAKPPAPEGSSAPALELALSAPSAPALFPAPEDAAEGSSAPFPALNNALEEAQPLSPEDFEEYKFLIADRAKLAYTTSYNVDINGTPRNAKWVQYNLLQFCKHPALRRFHHDENNFFFYFDHHRVSMEIDRMISEKKIRMYE